MGGSRWGRVLEGVGLCAGRGSLCMYSCTLGLHARVFVGPLRVGGGAAPGTRFSPDVAEIRLAPRRRGSHRDRHSPQTESETLARVTGRAGHTHTPTRTRHDERLERLR